MKQICFFASCWLLSLAASLALAGEVDRSICEKLSVTYFAKPLRQTIDEFAARSLPDQYAIYICGNQYMHPPALHLAAPFAAQGAPVASFLEMQLSATSSDLVVRDILRVFAEMKRQHTYDVQANESLMSLIKKKAAAVSSRYWRDYIANVVSQLVSRP